jgi:hypothetical protein
MADEVSHLQPRVLLSGITAGEPVGAVVTGGERWAVERGVVVSGGGELCCALSYTAAWDNAFLGMSV